jgi:hypothetical protein
MIELALQIRPDLAAEICPAFAEGKILGQIGAGRGIDHAFEQRKPFRRAHHAADLPKLFFSTAQK